MTFSGSIVALVTPMDGEGRIDYGALERLVAFHVEAGSDGLVVGGTTGESPTLTADELESLVRRTVELAGGRLPVIAGSGTSSTARSTDLTRRVCAAGADACLVVTPYYNRPTQDGLLRHYRAVADAAEAPVILYNVPGRTACDLTAETARRLSEHPRIVAIKDATADIGRARELHERCADALAVLSGDDRTALELMQAGARGVISVTANVAPAAMAAMCRSALAGDVDAAAAQDARLQPLHVGLFVESNPIPVKFALHAMGLIAAGIRLPLTWLRSDHQATVLEALRAAGVAAA